MRFGSQIEFPTRIDEEIAEVFKLYNKINSLELIVNTNAQYTFGANCKATAQKIKGDHSNFT